MFFLLVPNRKRTKCQYSVWPIHQASPLLPRRALSLFDFPLLQSWLCSIILHTFFVTLQEDMKKTSQCGWTNLWHSASCHLTLSSYQCKLFGLYAVVLSKQATEDVTLSYGRHWCGHFVCVLLTKQLIESSTDWQCKNPKLPNMPTVSEFWWKEVFYMRHWQNFDMAEQG